MMLKKKKKKLGVAIIIALGKKNKRSKKDYDESYENKEESMQECKMHNKREPKSSKLKNIFKNKVGKAMHDFKEDEMHPGSSKAPATKNRKQAIAIALSMGKKSVDKAKKRKKK